MFWDPNNYTESRLKCSVKLVSEILSFCSLIFSVFIVVTSFLYLKMTLFNKLILQIIISKIIDGISILLEVVRDSYGINYFEKYNSIKFFCFSQIYLSLFSCLWTLTASFFISLRLYDMTVKRNKIFHKKLLEKITPLISIAFSMILSFIICCIQVSSQSKGRKNLSKGEFYNP